MIRLIIYETFITNIYLNDINSLLRLNINISKTFYYIMVKLNGLFQKSFEDAINTYTLRFHNKEIEKKYLNDRNDLNFLNKRSKYFFIISAITICLVYLIDMYLALQVPSYFYSIDEWICMVLMIPILLIEFIFVFNKCFKNLRGIIISVVGTLTQFISNYGSFQDIVFYPFVGTEYFIS